MRISYGPPAFIPGITMLQRPEAAAVTVYFRPAMLKVTFSPGAAVPFTLSSRPRCNTMPSANNGGSTTSGFTTAQCESMTANNNNLKWNLCVFIKVSFFICPLCVPPWRTGMFKY
ncbi:hypothetical protein [Bacteroides caecigallinarum]|uniref:hypothetical protein n=1 Tax=Bacteroides caecigallinarum TaxID=1411144 RepID=UPI001EF6782A|nr:hypothetical protein [Bacteroides caecigallinarum]